ncbi:ketoreductase domain-containing protein [Aspergillus foveolatus]|uniref:ketoreductase domain-containing protein n=1 Tax=Aspergillus foveolatus TaxID=210207 RepID=UPI003CCE04BE
MDSPCFRDLTEQRLQALQKLISVTNRLLWVTAGRESDCLDLGLTKGWLRSLAYERRESLHQYLNVEDADAVTAELLATTLMRLVYTESGNDHMLSELVHYENEMNQRYLSARQWVSKEVRVTDEISVIIAHASPPFVLSMRTILMWFIGITQTVNPSSASTAPSSSSRDVMQSTFAAKVQGSILLDELSGPDVDLDFFILFGSITGVAGNFKQTAYSPATGYQSSLVHARRARGLVGSIIRPGLISGVGYITRKGSRWVQHVCKTTGSLLLSERDLDKLFAEAIFAGRPQRDTDSEIIIGLPLIDPEQHPDIFWYSNPLTWDFIDYSIKSTSQLGCALHSRGTLKAALQSDSISSIEALRRSSQKP